MQKIEATILGSGTSQGVPVIACKCNVCRSENPKDKRLRSSLLINVNKKNIVIDAGPDFRQQMLSNNVNSLRAILLTHEHVDHIFGLDDIRAFNWIQHQPTDIFAEERVQQAIKRIFHYVFAQYKYPGVPEMNLHHVNNCEFYVDDIPILPIRCIHYKLPVLGFRVGDLTYITDTNYIASDEIDKIRGTRVLILNALRREKHISHFSLDEAIEFAQMIRPEKTFFTHISHNMGKFDEIQEKLPNNIFLAYDGLNIVV